MNLTVPYSLAIVINPRQSLVRKRSIGEREKVEVLSFRTARKVVVLAFCDLSLLLSSKYIASITDNLQMGDL